MMLKELTPNKFIDGSVFRFRFISSEKSEELDGLVSKLDLRPLNSGIQNTRDILGRGDGSFIMNPKKRSTKGSVVIALNEQRVAKIPLGEMMRESIQTTAVAWLGATRLLAEISPATDVVIVEVDEYGPKPIIIQDRIVGKQICNSPMSNLFNEKTLKGMIRVIEQASEVYKKTGAIDIWGQSYEVRNVGKLLSLIPFFSNNIMIDQHGEVLLCDNVLDPIQHVRMSRAMRFRDSLKLISTRLILNTALVAVKTWDMLGGKHKDLPTGRNIPKVRTI